MALRLRVVSDHRRSLGDRGNIVFGVGGGTIGRSADNDWVLPDPNAVSITRSPCRVGEFSGRKAVLLRSTTVPSGVTSSESAAAASTQPSTTIDGKRCPTPRAERSGPLKLARAPRPITHAHRLN